MKSLSHIFSDAFCCESTNESTEFVESIMDYPNGGGLCPDIWDSNGDSFILNRDVREKALEISNWVIEKYQLKNPLVRIIGSICSNAYESDSDLDIHITDTSLSFERREEINSSLAEEFKKQFEPNDNDLYKGHPFEIYVQENEFRDLLSVGCYNIETDEWESGPTIYPSDYDPFTEYYEKIYTTNDELIGKIRDFIMSVQEYCYTVEISKKSSNQFRTTLGEIAYDVKDNASELLDEARNMRGALTEPKSKEEAEETKNDENWKISDATFKLLGKYGYMSILKKLSKINPDDNLDSISNSITDIFSSKLFKIKSDTENEKLSI